MPKTQTIILVVIILIVFGGLIGWSIFQKSKLPAGEESGQEEEPQEVLSLSGVVQSVDVENNALMVKPVNQESEVKVIISETTSLIKLEFPFDPKNPPKEGTFTPKQTEIEISNFKQGDNIFIKVKENISGKTEFDNVDFIHILP